MARPRNSANAEKPADAQTGAASAAPVAESVDEQAKAAAQAEADAAAAAQAEADAAAAAQAEADAAAAAQAEADAAATAQAEADTAAEPTLGYRVTGAAVVLRTVDGAERYLYRGAPFAAGVFTEDSVERAVENSLVSETE